MFQDSQGYLWIGTNNGLSRYDGTQFTNYSTVQGLSNNWITDIAESPKEPGTLWVGTVAGGVNRIRDGSVTVFRPGRDDASNNINSIAVDTSGTVWASTYFGLFMIRDDSIRRVINPEVLRGDHLVGLKDGSIWMAVDNRLFTHSPNETAWRSLPPLKSADGVITDLARCRAGGLWVGWSSGRITRMQGTKTVFEVRQPSAGPQRICDDGNGKLWVRTRDALIVITVSSPETAKRIPIPQEMYVPNDVALPLVLDAEKDVWVGTWAAGMMMLADRNLSVTPLQFDSAGAANTMALSDRNGHIWVTARGGINEVYRDTKTGWRQHLHSFVGVRADEESYVSLIDGFGRIWVITKELQEIRGFLVGSQPNRPSKLSPLTVLRRGKHFPEGMLLTLLVDARNHMFISIGKVGVAVVNLDPPVLLGLMTQSDSVPGSDVRVLFQDDKEQIWMGGWNDGISVFSPGPSFPKFFRRYTLSDGLPDNSIRAFHQDASGVMWIGTRHGGIASLKDGRFNTVSMREGLLSNSIWNIEEDEHGQLYLLTDVGIERIDRQTSTPLMQKSELLLPQGGSLGIVPGKYIWYASTEGLTTYDYTVASSGARPPPVHILSLVVNGKTIATNQRMEFSHNQNNCTIEYVGISFKDEKAVRYQYRLFGVDSTWTQPVAHRAVTFANLRPGEYCFEVRAISGDGVASVVPASLAFLIIPPFWQRWWFIALCVVAANALLYAGYKYRVRSVLALERLRTRIAADLHDDVGTNLSSIMLATQLMERKFPLSDAERGELSRLRLTAGLTREMLKDIVWFLNPMNDSPENFILKLKEIAGRILQNLPFEFHTSGVDRLESMNLETKRNIVLMFKETLTNIIKHAEAKSVDIDGTCAGDTFILTIRDDGRGFDAGAQSQGNGITNLRSRAGNIGGKIEICTAPGEGTLLRLTVNITHKRNSKTKAASVDF